MKYITIIICILGLVLGSAVSFCFAEDIQVSPYRINVDRPAAELKIHADTDYYVGIEVFLSICLITGYDENDEVICGAPTCEILPLLSTPDVNTDLYAHFDFDEVLGCFEECNDGDCEYVYGNYQFTLTWGKDNTWASATDDVRVFSAYLEPK